MIHEVFKKDHFIHFYLTFGSLSIVSCFFHHTHNPICVTTDGHDLHYGLPLVLLEAT